MTNYKLFISFLLAASICLLTACGGGGGGSSSPSTNIDSNNRAIQATCIAGIITDLKSNINNIFPSNSSRFSSKPILRASLSEIATGEELMKLCGITGITNEGGFVDQYNDSIEKFKKRNNNIVYQSNSMAIAENGNRHIGLSIFTLGSAQIKTYFATEENSSEIVGVSYIKYQNYTTFAFKTFKGFNSLEGRVFKFDQNTFSYNEANIKGFSLAEVYGDDTNFNYIDLNENTSDVFSYKGELISNGNGKNPDITSYLDKYPETIGIRYAVKPILDNSDKILKVSRNSSNRASIEIPDSLKQYNTLAKVRTLIPATTINEFKSSFSNYELLLDKQIATDTVITTGVTSLIAAKDSKSGLIVGLLVEVADISFNQQKMSPTTLGWLVADPNGKAIICFAYCNTNDSKSSSTFIFRINPENKNMEGKGFWNDEVQPSGLFENYGFDDNDYQINCRNSIFIGSTPEQFTYTLYNSQNRNKTDGFVTIKYDGTLISTK